MLCGCSADMLTVPPMGNQSPLLKAARCNPEHPVLCLCFSLSRVDIAGSGLVEGQFPRSLASLSGPAWRVPVSAGVAGWDTKNTMKLFIGVLVAAVAACVARE